jgi:hypothetical protein
MDPEVTPGDSPPAAALVGIGCLTAFSGLFAGGMIAVFIAKVVGSIRGCEPATDLPACDWGSYALVGMLVGVVVFPTISIIRLKRRRS